MTFTLTSDSSPEETLILSSILTTFEGFSFRLDGNLETSCIDGNFDESFTVRSLHVPEQTPKMAGKKYVYVADEKSIKVTVSFDNGRFSNVADIESQSCRCRGLHRYE